MEAESKTENNQNQTDLKSKLLNHYQEYVLLKGEEPPSVFAFCKEVGIDESEFYQYYNDFGQLAGAFWTETFNTVKSALNKDPEFNNFSVREKLLSFYYGFFEKLKKNRSYALLSFKESTSILNREHRHLKAIKSEFKAWARELVSEGVNNDEIASRTKISDTYDNLFWLQCLFLINFWIKDDSTGFDKTDAAIEKSVNFGFDIIERNALDSALDFGKFLFQNR